MVVRKIRGPLGPVERPVNDKEDCFRFNPLTVPETKIKRDTDREFHGTVIT